MRDVAGEIRRLHLAQRGGVNEIRVPLDQFAERSFTAAFGVVAEQLGWPHATIIMQIEKTDGGIRVKRELEAGYFQFVDMPVPAVLTIQSGINKLRYATLLGIKQAKTKPLKKISFDELKAELGENLQKIEKLYIPQKTKRTEKIEGPPAEVAKKLVDKLRNDVHVL